MRPSNHSESISPVGKRLLLADPAGPVLEGQILHPDCSLEMETAMSPFLIIPHFASFRSSSLTRATLAIILCVLGSAHVRAAERRAEEAASMVLKELVPGSFKMGSDFFEKGRKSDEGKQTAVTLTYRFWIGKYEVTQDEYVNIMNENPSFFNGDRQMAEGPRDFGIERRRPVENVTWIQAIQFCRELTKKEQGSIPAGYEYRLPTEAEWEYACRAGSNSSFSFGESRQLLGEYAWAKQNSGDQVQPVGKKKPNGWDLYDMQGNVMEWCMDWYQSKLPGGSVTNWVGPESGTDRILRGGGWANDDPANFRCADRWHQPPTEKGNGYGFRIVLAPPIESLRKKQ